MKKIILILFVLINLNGIAQSNKGKELLKEVSAIVKNYETSL